MLAGISSGMQTFGKPCGRETLSSASSLAGLERRQNQGLPRAARDCRLRVHTPTRTCGHSAQPLSAAAEISPVQPEPLRHLQTEQYAPEHLGGSYIEGAFPSRGHTWQRDLYLHVVP